MLFGFFLYNSIIPIHSPPHKLGWMMLDVVTIITDNVFIAMVKHTTETTSLALSRFVFCREKEYTIQQGIFQPFFVVAIRNLWNLCQTFSDSLRQNHRLFLPPPMFTVLPKPRLKPFFYKTNDRVGKDMANHRAQWFSNTGLQHVIRWARLDKL